MSRSVLQRIASGDPSAVDECVEKYRRLIWSLVRSQVKNIADAEDAVQEILIAIWRNAARFDPAVASEATFITMIARRRLIDRHRRQSRATAVEPLVEEPASGVLSETRGIESAEQTQQALQAMQLLRPEERLVLELTLLEGRTQQEIAAATNMPLGTVKTHARRGLMRLRAILKSEQEISAPGKMHANQV